jgi:hypothetical protein
MAVVVAALLFILAVAVPDAALAYPTLTAPADGQTVKLDSHGNALFAWTLPQGEVGPEVDIAPASQVSNPPSVDPQTGAPFGMECPAPEDPDNNWAPGFSCAGPPLGLGRYYAYMADFVPAPDDSGGFSDEHGSYNRSTSPFTTFVVPTFLVWGPNDPLANLKPIDASPYSTHPSGFPLDREGFEVNAYFNEQHGAVPINLVVKKGKKTVERVKTTGYADDLPEGGLMQQTISAKRPHGVRRGTKLTGVITISAGGVTLPPRSVKFKAPY